MQALMIGARLSFPDVFAEIAGSELPVANEAFAGKFALALDNGMVNSEFNGWYTQRKNGKTARIMPPRKGVDFFRNVPSIERSD